MQPESDPSYVSGQSEQSMEQPQQQKLLNEQLLVGTHKQYDVIIKRK